jgi:hypothetical protein
MLFASLLAHADVLGTPGLGKINLFLPFGKAPNLPG